MGKIGEIFKKFRKFKIAKVNLNQRKKCYNSPKEVFPEIEKFMKWAWPPTGRFIANRRNFADSRPNEMKLVSIDWKFFSLSIELCLIWLRPLSAELLIFQFLPKWKNTKFYNFAASRPAVTKLVSFESLNFSLSIEFYFTWLRPFWGELLLFEIFWFFLFSKNSIFFFTRASRPAVTSFRIFWFGCRNFID